jgi:hypothetical protein
MKPYTLCRVIRYDAEPRIVGRYCVTVDTPSVRAVGPIAAAFAVAIRASWLPSPPPNFQWTIDPSWLQPITGDKVIAEVNAEAGEAHRRVLQQLSRDYSLWPWKRGEA